MPAKRPGSRYGASLEFRTTFDQAGRVAGLAGELEVSEAEVMRRLLNWALADTNVLGRLRAELVAEAERQERDLREAERTGKIPGGVPLDIEGLTIRRVE
jgi:hypothetical protein